MVYGKEHMEKDTCWKTYFEDNHRYADIINGIGFTGVLEANDTGLSGKYH